MHAAWREVHHCGRQAERCWVRFRVNHTVIWMGCSRLDLGYGYRNARIHNRHAADYRTRLFTCCRGGGATGRLFVLQRKREKHVVTDTAELPFSVWDHASALVPASSALPHGAICIVGGRAASSSGFNQRAYLISLDPSTRFQCWEVKLRYASLPSFYVSALHWQRTCVLTRLPERETLRSST